MALDGSESFLPGFPESVQSQYGSEECVRVLLEVMRDYIQSEWFHINDLPKPICRAFYKRMNKIPETSSFKRPRAPPARQVNPKVVKVDNRRTLDSCVAKRPVSKGKDMNKLRATAGASIEDDGQQTKGTDRDPDKELLNQLGVQDRIKGLKIPQSLLSVSPALSLHQMRSRLSELRVETSETKDYHQFRDIVREPGTVVMDYFIVRDYTSTTTMESEFKDFACNFLQVRPDNFCHFVDKVKELVDKGVRGGLDLIVRREMSNNKFVFDILFVDSGTPDHARFAAPASGWFARLGWN